MAGKWAGFVSILICALGWSTCSCAGDDQRFRLLTLVDNHSRESLAIEVGQRLTGDDVVRVLEQVSTTRGKPQTIRVDNGPEFV
jgi:transposase InsO family protein